MAFFDCLLDVVLTAGCELVSVLLFDAFKGVELFYLVVFAVQDVFSILFFLNLILLSPLNSILNRLLKLLPMLLNLCIMILHILIMRPCLTIFPLQITIHPIPIILHQLISIHLRFLYLILSRFGLLMNMHLFGTNNLLRVLFRSDIFIC